jgi:hypothetical protein
MRWLKGYDVLNMWYGGCKCANLGKNDGNHKDFFTPTTFCSLADCTSFERITAGWCRSVFWVTSASSFSEEQQSPHRYRLIGPGPLWAAWSSIGDWSTILGSMLMRWGLERHSCIAPRAAILRTSVGSTQNGLFGGPFWGCLGILQTVLRS